MGSFATLAALAAVMIGGLWLGTIAQRFIERGRFLQSYFLGNRDLGSWALALSATVQSGGTFMGFPALVYSHGWSVSLWIAGYMLVPLTAFALVGKRLARMSRALDALTVPDFFRLRFESPTLGLVTSLFVLYLLVFTMIGQFKAGALVMKLAWPHSTVLALSETESPAPAEPPSIEKSATDGTPLAPTTSARTQPAGWDVPYLTGLLLFAVTVTAYTLLGGFTASVWADVFQSILMLIGVVVLAWLVYLHGPGLEAASRIAAERTGPAYLLPQGFVRDRPEGMFLPWGAAFSMFFVWVCGGISSPASIVRTMACRDSQTLRRSILILGAYNLCIYPPLILICIQARAILPDLAVADEVVPRITLEVTRGHSWGPLTAGLILAAPFGAVMATVSCYLLVIASGLVNDLYRRFVRPAATEAELRRLTTLAMVALGTLSVLACVRPPSYLQMLVVFSASSSAGAFFMPLAIALHWRRATAAGMLAAMLAGGGTTLFWWVCGCWTYGELRPYLAGGIDPVVWSLLVSGTTAIVVSLRTQPPSAERLALVFPPPPPQAAAVRPAEVAS